MGRPTKLTPEAHKRIISALKTGCSRKDAAGAAAVDYRSLLNWCQRGEVAGRGRYFQFFRAVQEAEALPRVLAYTSIQKGWKKDWRAADAFLKGRDPEYRQRQEVSGPNGGPIPMTWNLSKLTEEELAELEKLVRRAS